MDEKQKEEFKTKAKEASKVTAKAIGQLTKWTIKKSKEGYVRYQKYSEEQAEQTRLLAAHEARVIKEKRLHEEKEEKQRQIELEKKREQQAILAKKKRIEDQKLAVIKRNQRHEKLCEILQDPLEVLETDIGIFFKNDSNGIISHTFLDYAKQGLEPRLSDNVFDCKEELESVLNKGAFHVVQRTVVDLSEKEIGVLKLMSFFNKVQLITDRTYAYTELCISYNEGKSAFYAKKNRLECSDNTYSALMELIPCCIKVKARPPSPVINESLALLGRARKEVNDPELTALIEKELKGAEGWMKASAI